MAAAPKKTDYSDISKPGSWIKREHYKLDLIHYAIIFTLLGGVVFFGGLLIMSYIGSTKSLVATVMTYLT